jgi:hypothetical protein
MVFPAKPGRHFLLFSELPWYLFSFQSYIGILISRILLRFTSLCRDQ